MTADRTGPLRLAWLTGSYPRASDTFIREEVAALRRRGHQVETFSVRRPPLVEVTAARVDDEAARTTYLLEAPFGQWLRHGVSALARGARLAAAVSLARRLRTPGWRGAVWPWLYLLEALHLAGHLRARGVQHLHVHISEGAASVAMLSATLAGIPWSMTAHGPGEFDHPRLLSLQVKVHQASFVVAISDFTRAQLLRWVDPTVWDRVHVVRCGVAPDFLTGPLTPVPEHGRLICVGRLVAEKGQALLVQAVADLAGSGTLISLVLVGDGPDRSRIESIVRLHGIEHLVSMRGWLSAHEVRDLVTASRCTVLPSFAEGLPVVLMESLALGRPVIATRIAGIPELVVDGVNGWLVAASDAVGLRAALVNATELDPGALSRLGAQGHVLVGARHDIDRSAQALEELMLLAQASAAPTT